MTPLSPHFSLEELTFSEVALRKGIDNASTLGIQANLTRLCVVLLEPIRTLLAVPIHVNSGYRSAAVNEAVGGAPNSAHLSGCAADIVPIGMDLKAAFDAIRLSGLPFDQLLFECQAWLHVSVPLQPDGTPRHQPMLASGSPGHWTYSLA
jgi:zinc D-Ala-D-Ala carboxypeptidase